MCILLFCSEQSKPKRNHQKTQKQNEKKKPKKPHICFKKLMNLEPLKLESFESPMLPIRPRG
jgi:hypothetical protein